MKTIDKYLSTALDNYPYSLEITIESLDYALSYDDKNVTALLLYARVYSEQLMQFEEAKGYFERALAADVLATAVYPYYIRTLIFNEDYDEAEKLIAFALTIKGVSKPDVLYGRVALYEKTARYKKALKALKEVRTATMHSQYDYYFNDAEARIKAKRKLQSGKKSKKKAE